MTLISHRPTHRTVIILVGIATLAVVGVGIILLTPGSRDQPQQPAGPAQVADQFAAVYAAGDTPAACEMTAGAALDRLQSAGLCAAPAGWSVTPTLTTSCTLPDGGTDYVYNTSAEVNRHIGFEVIVTGTGDTAWKVTKLLTPNPRSLCDIYRG